jgi:hypothetical protein
MRWEGVDGDVPRMPSWISSSHVLEFVHEVVQRAGGRAHRGSDGRTSGERARMAMQSRFRTCVVRNAHEGLVQTAAWGVNGWSQRRRCMKGFAV